MINEFRLCGSGCWGGAWRILNGFGATDHFVDFGSRVDCQNDNVGVTLFKDTENLISKRLSDRTHSFEIQQDFPKAFESTQYPFGLGSRDEILMFGTLECQQYRCFVGSVTIERRAIVHGLIHLIVVQNSRGHVCGLITDSKLLRGQTDHTTWHELPKQESSLRVCKFCRGGW